MIALSLDRVFSFRRQFTTHFRVSRLNNEADIADANYILFARLKTITSCRKFWNHKKMRLLTWSNALHPMHQYIYIIMQFHCLQNPIHFVAFECKKSLKSFQMLEHTNWRVPYTYSFAVHRLNLVFLQWFHRFSPSFFFCSSSPN